MRQKKFEGIQFTAHSNTLQNSFSVSHRTLQYPLLLILITFFLSPSPPRFLARRGSSFSFIHLLFIQQTFVGFCVLSIMEKAMNKNVVIAPETCSHEQNISTTYKIE